MTIGWVGKAQLTLLGVCAVTVFGCITSSSLARPIGDKRYAPRPADHPVDIYIKAAMVTELRAAVASDALRTRNLEIALAETKSAETVPEDAHTVGEVNVTGEEGVFWTSMYRVARRKARELGGDGLVPTRWNYYVDAGMLWKRFTFSIVRYGE